MCWLTTPVGWAHFRGRDASGKRHEDKKFWDIAVEWVSLSSTKRSASVWREGGSEYDYERLFGEEKIRGKKKE
jgi:hypothetical protein